MNMKRIALLRWNKLPSFVTWEIPNTEELLAEDKLVLEGFHTHGFEAVSVIWNQPNVDWNQFDAALIRSTWDYIDEAPRFLEVLTQIENSSCRLFNPLNAIRWNIDKNYLFDLEKSGAPIIPTYLTSKAKPGKLQDVFRERNWQTAILKPTLGTGGANSYKVNSSEIESTLQTIKVTNPGQDYLIQPFIDSVVTEGEWSFIFFNRQLSHVLLKRPAPKEYRVQGIYGGTVEIAEPQSRDLEQAESILAALPFDLLYARLDLIRVHGVLSVMEVELIEPILSFNLVPEGVERFVNAMKIVLGEKQ
jgi:glutathione synthase/RimK-type ligase-like ATP-grasp enzyme